MGSELIPYKLVYLKNNIIISNQKKLMLQKINVILIIYNIKM